MSGTYMPPNIHKIAQIKMVHRLKAEGQTVPAIARLLGVSEELVRGHLNLSPATGTALYARTFGPDNRYWSIHALNNHTYIKVQQNWFNDRLRACGFLFLNDVYEAFGFGRTQIGQLVGWYREEGSNEVEIEIVGDSEDGGLILDFNPDGVIYSRLP